MIEMLLILTIAAGVLVFAAHRYFVYRQNLQLVTLKNDVRTIRFALQRYFYENGCAYNGIFEGNSQPDLTADLHINEESQSLPPIVQSYQAAVVDTGLRTDQNKPLYHLRVLANFSPTLSARQLNAYLKELDATNVEQSQLIWESAPQSTVNGKNNYWVMDLSRETFRRQENKKFGKREGFTSHAYCAQ